MVSFECCGFRWVFDEPRCPISAVYQSLGCYGMEGSVYMTACLCVMVQLSSRVSCCYSSPGACRWLCSSSHSWCRFLVM